MMKEMMGTLMVCAMLLSGGAMAEGAADVSAPEATAIPLEEQAAEMAAASGTVLELNESNMLVQLKDMQVLVNVDEETVYDIARPLMVGDVVNIDYDGKMTKSEPAQMTADRLAMYLLEGNVTEVNAEENWVMLSTKDQGDVMVQLPEGADAASFEKRYAAFWFDGAMTTSLPGQISAQASQILESSAGNVTEIGEGYLMLETKDGALQVNVAGETLPEWLKVGEAVTIMHNGAMTRSIPPQVSAFSLLQGATAQ